MHFIISGYALIFLCNTSLNETIFCINSTVGIVILCVYADARHSFYMEVLEVLFSLVHSCALAETAKIFVTRFRFRFPLTRTLGDFVTYLYYRKFEMFVNRIIDNRLVPR